ncbi:MAG TPA: hypothetical protein VMA13_08820 [Candidatus Saccharimonadales bacterium]|nr:hypothetical protein [Candidatus Saccharimonadales bacterium]
MNDSNEEQLAINTARTKSVEAVQATKSGDPYEPPLPTTSVVRRKRRHLVRLIAMMALGVIAVIVYVTRPALAQSYEGLAAALCAIACGVLLVRRFTRLLAEEDKLQEQQLNGNQATVSPSDPNPPDYKRILLDHRRKREKTLNTANIEHNDPT